MLGKKKIAIFTSFVIFSLGASFMGSFAWFANTVTMTKDNTNINGASMAGYFAYGDGQPYEEDENGKVIHRPYGISIPRHLRNLAWLQYLGNFSSKKYYFELADSVSSDGLDMSTYGVLPPIGTEDNPFISQFNGNGKIITGLKVSNDSSVLFASDNPHPDIDLNDFEAPKTVGMFGVIGNTNGTDPGASVYNFGLTGATIYSTTSNALAGILAGYSSGTIANVAVNNSSINIKSGTSAFDNTLTSNLSDYSLIGYTTKKSTISKLNESIRAVNVTQNINFNASDDGKTTGWGGSIAIKDIHERLNDIKANNAARGSALTYKDVTYNADGTESGTPTTKTASSWKSGNTTYFIRTYNENNYASSYNPKLGAFQFASEVTDFHYLSGGHYAKRQYYSYYEHSGIAVTDGTNYMTVQNRDVTANNSKITNTQSEENALRWSYTNNKLTTTYNGKTYYLYRYNSSNTDLRLTTTSGDGITLTKEISGNKFRYVYNGTHYLKRSNNTWILEALPTLRPEPTDVPKPTETISKPTVPELSEPTIWRPAQDPGANSHYYYIYSDNNYFNSSGSNTTKTNTSSTNTVYWDFGANLSETTKTGTIKNVNNSRFLYLNWTNIFGFKFNYNITVGTSGNSNSWRTTLNTSTNVGTIRNNNETGHYLMYNNGWSQNDSSANVNIYSVHQAYLDWRAYDENQELWGPYKENKAAWVAYNDHEAWKKEKKNYDEVLVPATYAMSDKQLPDIKGPDNYLDNSRAVTGMDYSEQDATYFPLNVHEKDEDGSLKYEPLDSNTGYIIAGATYASSSSSYSIGNVRISSYYSISDNILNYDTTDHLLKNIYTIDSSGLHTINDQTQTFEKYRDSKISVEEILKEGESTDSVYGLHFMDATINKNNFVVARYAMVNGTNYSNYQMPANSIDFNLKEKGYINFFAGAYGNLSGEPTTIDSFFSLHMIRRYGEGDTIPEGKKVGDIRDIYEIEQVLSDGNKKHSYVYKILNGGYTVPYSYDANDQSIKYVLDSVTTENPNGYLITDVEHGGYADGHFHQLANAPTGYNTVSFETDWIKNNTIDSNSPAFHNAFYFEIPMNHGEFALGSVSGKDYGGYLIYLDIGANAAKTQRTQIVERFDKTTNEYDYPLGVALTNPGNTVDATDSVCATISSSFSGEMTINRNGNDVTVTGIGGQNPTITPTYKGDSITSIKPSADGTNVNIVPIRSVTDIVKRMQFYDYNVAAGELTRTEITDTSINGGQSFNRIIKQVKIDESTGNETAVAEGKVKIYRSSNGVAYKKTQSTDEAMDQTDLTVALLNTAAIVSFDYSGLNIDYELYERLVMEYDDTNLTGRFYKFDQYTVEVTVTSGKIKFTITSKDDNYTVYINSTQITTYDQQNPQTITIPNQ